MATHYLEIFRRQADTLRALGRSKGIYTHTSGKGDERERLVRDAVGEHLGTSFGLAKAEIVDSSGASSLEHDLVIYDHDVSAILSADASRSVVTVESVVVVIEVKSRLDVDAKSVEREVNRLAPLSKLQRLYQFTPYLAAGYRAMRTAPGNPTAVDMTAFLADGVGARARADGSGVERILTAYFGFDGPTDESVLRGFAKDVDADIVCTLHGATISRIAKSRGLRTVGIGEDAFCGFIGAIRSALEAHRASRFLAIPDSSAYTPAGRETTGGDPT